VICGAAPHNIASGANAPVEGGIAATHGGSDENDNSGTLRYVRIEFPGQPLTTASNSEINGLSLYSVGRGTQIDHVQVSYSGDDAYEWFGGTVNAKYLIACYTQDDDFDTDNGYRGRVQFALSQRLATLSDQSGSTAFESDNDAQGSTRTPQTRPFFSNVTVIGPLHNGLTSLPTGHNFTRALHIRRNSALSVYNSVFTGFPGAGLYLDGKRSAANAVADTLQFQNNVIAGIPNANDVAASSSTDTTINGTLVNQAFLRTWALAGNYQNDTLSLSNDILLGSPFVVEGAPSFLPQANSTLLSRASFANPRLGGVTGLFSSASKTYKLNLFPNPAADQVNVNLVLDKNATIDVRIYDLSGKELLAMPSFAAEAGQNTINLPTQTLRNGIYSVAITTPEGRSTSRLVVNR
jgi:hypothetical protein